MFRARGALAAGPGNGRATGRNAEGKLRVTLLHFTINTNRRPTSPALLDQLETAFQAQLNTFVHSWPVWLGADSVSLVQAPPFQGGIEVGPRTQKVHAHLVMTFVHRTWVDLRRTRSKIQDAKRSLGLTLFAYVGMQVGNATETYMRLYAEKDAGRRMEGVAGPAENPRVRRSAGPP